MNKYKITYPAESVDKPILSSVILECGEAINVLSADVDYERGSIVISVEGGSKNEEKVVKAFKKLGVSIEKLSKTLLKDEDSCIDCGACTGVCPVDALSMVDKILEIDQDACMYCGACVQVCPVRALEVRE